MREMDPCLQDPQVDKMSDPFALELNSQRDQTRQGVLQYEQYLDKVPSFSISIDDVMFLYLFLFKIRDHRPDLNSQLL